MAAKKKDTPDPAPADRPLEQPTELRESDQTANAGPGDAELHDPPVRTDRPDTPVLTSLAVGAGAHEPPEGLS